MMIMTIMNRHFSSVRTAEWLSVFGFSNYYSFGSGLFGYMQNWKNCMPKSFPEEQTGLIVFHKDKTAELSQR